MIMDDCPNCGRDLETEDNVMSICQDPYNGIIIECDCGVKLDLDIMITATDFSGE